MNPRGRSPVGSSCVRVNSAIFQCSLAADEVFLQFCDRLAQHENVIRLFPQQYKYT